MGRSRPPRLWGSTPAAPRCWCPESWLCGRIAPANDGASSPGVCYKDPRHWVEGPQSSENLTSHSCKDSTSKSGPILRCWADVNFGGHCLFRVGRAEGGWAAGAQCSGRPGCVGARRRPRVGRPPWLCQAVSGISLQPAGTAHSFSARAEPQEHMAGWCMKGLS